MLFPMEKVYESYVAKNMKRVFGDEGWNVSAQDSKYYLFDEPKKFALRPDIVVNASCKTIVMDTKWKKLIYFVDVSKIDESLGELKGIIKEKMERIFY